MRDKILVKTKRLYRRMRCWMNNETFEEPLPKTKSEIFQDKIFEELGSLLSNERYCFQKGKILLPTKYSIFISEDDSAEWYGNKRQALERAINTYLNSFINPAAAENTLMPHGFTVRLEPDRNLQKDEIRIIPQWENQDFKIKVRVKSPAAEDFSMTSAFSDQTRDLSFNYNLDPPEHPEDETVVNCRSHKLFDLEIYFDEVFLKTIPIYNPNLKIGRGSNAAKVDVPLTEDPEISRLHAELNRNQTGRYLLTVKGKNPVFVNGAAVHTGQSKELVANENLRIGMYSLLLRPGAETV